MALQLLPDITDALNFATGAQGATGNPGAPSAPKAAGKLAQNEKSYAPAPVKKVLNAETGAANAVNAAGDVASFLTSTSNWIRIGEVIAGLILLVMGLKTLAGGQSTIISTAGRAAGKAVAFA